jgi:hypothetical protein
VLGDVTEYELTGLEEGTLYYVALTAFDTSDNESEKSDEESGVPLSSDTQDPTVTITSPTSSPTYAISNSTINIGGSSSDNVGVTQVTWANNRGGSGSASGTTSWSVANISLQEGHNIITVTAHDAASNTGSDTLTITYSPDMTIIQYNSTDPTLILTGSVPEEGFMSIHLPDNLDRAISSTLFLTLWDPDMPGEGFIYINDNEAIDLPVGPYDNLEHAFEIPIDPNYIITGENIFRFTHVATAGYEVRALALEITFTSYQDNTDPVIDITSPTTSSTYSTANSTISIGGSASDNVGVTQVTWSNNRGGSGSASGTDSWSVSNISLQSGNNVITFTALDAADNNGTDSITINYTPPTTSTTSSVIPTTTTSVASTTTTTATPTTTTSVASTTTTAAPTTTTSVASTTTTAAPTTTTSVASTTTTAAPTTTTSVASTTTTAAPTTSTTTPATTTTPGTTTTPVTTTIPETTTTTIQSDTMPPSGSITINNDNTLTNSLNVFLNLSVTDDTNEPLGNVITTPSGQEATADIVMTLSNDGQEWSALEPFTSSKLWTLEPGEGTKTVYAQFRDAAGNWMPESAQDHIIYEESETSCDDPQKLQPLSVTASSTSPRYSADNLIDGNPSTAWSSVISLFKKDQYITLDLGTIKKISGLSMYASRLFGVDFFPTNFTIQASHDNATWVDISSEQGYVFGQSLSSGNWEMSGLESRYIRIYITQSKTLFLLFKLAQIAEIEVYGCNTTVSSPLLAQENTSLLTEEDGHPEGSTPQKSGGQKELKQMLPTIPGKPIITLFE